jgi:hypothetical protein
MSYTLNHYNGQLITTVADGTIDASLDITLIGKNYAGYGQSQNENFVYLLENFANSVQPPRPVSGQIWYDSGARKLKFYDGSKFRSTSGLEIGSTAPSGLTVGDFWFNTHSNQLFAYTGTEYALIGPQVVAGSGTTQIQTGSLVDSAGATHPIIKAVNNGRVVFTTSYDDEYVIDSTINPLVGFTEIQPGITLPYTPATGVTTGPHRFWGTSTNAEKLGGIPASNFVQAGSAAFNQSVNFSDDGYTVGNPLAKLRVYNSGATTPTIINQVSDEIVFQTTSSGTQTPLRLKGQHLLPGITGVSDIGSSLFSYKNIYAGYVYSTAARADTLLYSGQYITPSTTPTNNSIAARTNSGDLYANTFHGVATDALRSDSLKVGATYNTTSINADINSIAVRTAVGDLYANTFHGVATQANTLKVGGSFQAADTAASGNTIAARDSSGNLTANQFNGVATNANFLKVNNAYFGTSTSPYNDTIAVRTPAGDLYANNFFGIASSASTLRVNSVNRTGSTVTAANTVAVRDSVGDLYANLFQGTAIAARYADLAEKYLADADYEVGTVVIIGGEKEITASRWGKRAIGAVSGHPAYLMNKDLEGGTAVALKGRVPVKVIGRIKKGDELIAADGGCASFAVPHASGVFALALESSDDAGVKLVECLIL